MPQTLSYHCPHCGKAMDVELHSGQEIFTCPGEECRRPFQVELPTARPAPALIVPPDYEAPQTEEPADVAPPVAQPAAAAETELLQVKPVMFRRYPLRYIAYLLMTVGGFGFLVYALLAGRPIVGLLAVAVALVGGYRLLVWWLRVNSTTLTVTTKRSVLRTGVLSAQSVEIPHAEVSDIQVHQDFINRMLDVGDLAVSGNGAEKKGYIVMAVPRVETIVAHIRNHRPHEPAAGGSPRNKPAGLLAASRLTAPGGAATEVGFLFPQRVRPARGGRRAPRSAAGEPMPQALLVEDNPLNRKLLRDILEIEFDVTEAESAERAADLLQSVRPDFILLDVQLPGMDGLTFLKRLKGDPATADIPVVVISAHAMPEDIRQASDSGCAEYVTKPLVEDPFAFAARMARLASRPRTDLSPLG